MLFGKANIRQSVQFEQIRSFGSKLIAQLRRNEPWRRGFSSKNEQAIKFDLKSSTAKAEAEKVEAGPPPSGGRRPFYKWFATSRGQKFVGVSFVAASIGSAVASIAPHTVGLQYTKDIYQHYSQGVATRISNEMMELLNEVANEMGDISEQELLNIRLFVLSQTEAFSWGDMGSKALLGYPAYFDYKEPREVPIDRMYFGVSDSTSPTYLTSKQLESAESTQFCRSMVLSREAKKFVLAREIMKLRSQPQYYQATLPPTFILLTLMIARTVNQKLDLFRRPPLLRGIAYVSILPTILVFYATFKDMHQRRIEGRVDASAAGISTEYARGGVEYYSKFMARNAALRSLQWDGARWYTMYGDFVPGLIRVKTKPLSERRDLCQQALG